MGVGVTRKEWSQEDPGVVPAQTAQHKAHHMASAQPGLPSWRPLQHSPALPADTPLTLPCTTRGQEELAGG